MLRDGASEKFLDRLDDLLEPPLKTRAERMREEWDDDEAFAGFQQNAGGFATN